MTTPLGVEFMKRTPNFKFQVIQGKSAFGILLVLFLIGLPLVLLVAAVMLGLGIIRAVFRPFLGGSRRPEVPFVSSLPEVQSQGDTWSNRKIIDVKAEVRGVS